MDETGKNPEDTHVTDIQTSQQKAGEFSLCEGKEKGTATVDSKVEEGSQGRGDFTQTSQQKNGEISLAESGQ